MSPTSIYLAVAILNAAGEMVCGQSAPAQLILYRAIRHIAYPDRDVYPKSRRGTKSNPVGPARRQSSVDLI